LILLIGVFLAIVAFIGVILLLSQPPTPDGNGGQNVPETTIVKAKVDIPLGTIVTLDMVEESKIPTTEAPADAIHDDGSAVGNVVRQDIFAGQTILNAHFSGSRVATEINVPAGKRAISLMVDQVTGVGTLIKPGDYVDVVIGLTSSSFPVVTVNPTDQSITVVQGLNGTSVKLLLQSLQVIQTILPPPTTDANGNVVNSGVVLNGQQELVILAGTANQVEVIKYIQMDANVSLVLRSAADFQERDPVTNEVIIPVDEITDGVILKTLIDKYGVLRPQLIEAILPTPTP
jgi:pilus assembly protein CpaB